MNRLYDEPWSERPEAEVRLSTPERDSFTAAEGYIPSDGLVDAANTALHLGQPLLLTGEPGTGKTHFADNLALRLGLRPPLRFEAKSDSRATDLFYVFDALGRFHAVHAGASGEVIDYIAYQALGKAILLSNEREVVAAKGLLSEEGFTHDGPRRSVVLIDEVDKAPRDFPNDVLTELEEGYFRVRELENQEVEADARYAPVVVITSNSERDLPDAFLRRCIYFDIPYPGTDALIEILKSRVGERVDGFYGTLVDLFGRLRGRGGLRRKRPATAELLDWACALKALRPGDEDPLAADRGLALRTLSAVVKTSEDFAQAKGVVSAWVNEKTT